MAVSWSIQCYLIVSEQALVSVGAQVGRAFGAARRPVEEVRLPAAEWPIPALSMVLGRAPLGLAGHLARCRSVGSLG